MPEKPYTCCLCGSEEFGYGNNPAPLGQLPNKCCNVCNSTRVIPARLSTMFNREFLSEGSDQAASAAIVGGIFTVSMSALIEHLGKALEQEDAPAATFFKDCIDYMGMSMVESLKDNQDDFPKEVEAAITQTLGITAMQLAVWEKNPSFEELTNLGSSMNPDVDTMSQVVLEDSQEFEDDFGVMYSAESEYENHIQEAFYEDILEDGTPQWDFLYRCNDCGSLCVANDFGRMDESEFCSDGGEDHDMEIIEMNEDEEYEEDDYDDYDWSEFDSESFSAENLPKGHPKTKTFRYKMDMNGPYLDMSNADLYGADLSGADLTDADLSNAYFFSANLFEAKLNSANLINANLKGAKILNANLERADLTGANLWAADLRNADLSATNLQGANLRYADLSGAVVHKGEIPKLKILRNPPGWNKKPKKVGECIGCDSEDIEFYHDYYGGFCGGDCFDGYLEENKLENYSITQNAESYVDFFTQMEELLESTTTAGNWTLDATTDQEDPDAVTMVVKFKPSDPSTFFDIIE